MNNPLNILVVEDSDQHFADFKVMLEGVQPKLPITIHLHRVRALTGAEVLTKDYDAVITELFFPNYPGGEEGPNGVKVVELCLEQQKPVVWVMATPTKQGDFREVDPVEWGRDRGIELFRVNQSPKALPMAWDEPFFALLTLIVGIEEGAYAIENGRIWGHDPSDRRFPQVSRITSKHATLGGRDILGVNLNQAVRAFLTPPPVIKEMLRRGFGRVYEE